MLEPSFAKIALRCGNQNNAFEELCCQIARKVVPVGSAFSRFRGSGGDGGVECLAHSPEGHVTGWQAKFVFEVDSLINHADDSLTTALKVHLNLREFVLCFPFDPTGPTGRKNRQGNPAKSQNDKLAAWTKRRVKEAKEENRDIKIALWPAHELTALLLQHDPKGGIREYFFNDTILSHEWFSRHLKSAAKSVEPRYSPLLSVDTPLWQWFTAFEGGQSWAEMLRSKLTDCRAAFRRLEASVKSTGGSLGPAWPFELISEGNQALMECDAGLKHVEQSMKEPTEVQFDQLKNSIHGIASKLRALDGPLAKIIDNEHGPGSAESKPLRSFMAEYMVSFPTENLDATRNALRVFESLGQWISSPNGQLAFHSVFVLTGEGGSGKTHGICDMALKRLTDGAYSCVVFGHQFRGEPVDWERFATELGLPTTLGRDALWDAMNAAAESTGKPLFICIDAINETAPRVYWKNRLKSFAAEICKRPNLKLCVSCRTSFERACLPSRHDYPNVEHQGFRGMERRACKAFFEHYGLVPPVTPILQPELSNPLYLKLVCETMQLRGLKHLPNGWFGLAPVIQSFLSAKEEQFATDHETLSGAAIVAHSLEAIASETAKAGGAGISWAEAQIAISKRCPHATHMPIIEWLVRENLLIEDGNSHQVGRSFESMLRPAFERL